MNFIKSACLVIALCTTSLGYSQFLDKLGKKAERAVERTVERRVERETEKSTDRALDSVIEAPKKSKKEKRKAKDKKKKGNNNVIGSPDTNSQMDSENEAVDKNEYPVNANFDFEPGTVLIFEDTFTRDNPGDFPAKWDSNGSGEIVSINGNKWFRLGNKTTFIPITSSSLPENYTIEFDLLTQGMDSKTSSQAMITLLLEDNSGFTKAKNWSMVELSPCQFIHSPGALERVENGQRVFRNQVGKDYRKTILGKSRISIAVNKTRMRVWINDNKIVDVPKLVANGANNFKIHTRTLRDMRDVDEVYITNFKIAKSGTDNRSKLLTEGRLSTNSILFDTGSATIQGSSNPVINEVAEAMMSVSDMNLLIVGHTDSDGSSDSNLKLSKQRADSVKARLISDFGISSNRFRTEGKGEASPVADNSSSTGKTQNRRVEFIKL